MSTLRPPPPPPPPPSAGPVSPPPPVPVPTEDATWAPTEVVGQPSMTLLQHTPDRVEVQMHMKYGLPNYGSVSVDVGYATSTKPEDEDDPMKTYLRAASRVNEMFMRRDEEVRSALKLDGSKQEQGKE